MTHFQRISVFDADKILATSATAKILEYRQQSSDEKCLHPRAELIDDTMTRALIRSGDKQSPIIIYARGSLASSDVAQMFSDFGFESCYSVDGGYSAWQNPIIDRFKVKGRLRFWLKSHGLEETIDNINSRVDDENKTAIMYAARLGNHAIVKELLACSADPNYTDHNGNNALWHAAMGGNLDCVQTLINSDAEVDNVNHRGFTTLDYCVGHEGIARALIESYPTALFNI